MNATVSGSAAVALVVCGFATVWLFCGEPDLQDALVAALPGEVGCTGDIE